MKILIITTNADLAGAPKHVLTLIKGLQADIHFMVVTGEHGPLTEQLSELKIPFQVLSGMRSAISPLNDLSSILALVRIIKEYRPDLIHLHSTKAGLVGRVAALITGLPFIYTVHGWGWRGLGLVSRRLVKCIEWSLARICRQGRFICVSQATLKEGQSVLGGSLNRCQVIPNGVPDHHLSKQVNPGFIILMAARVSTAKDHATLMKAFDQLEEDSELWLCGRGTDLADFFEEIRCQAPSRYSQVRTFGEVSDIQTYLERAHVVVLISHFEAMPLSVIEAMSAALPVVATDVGGVSEVIEDGVTGLLVPPSDSNALVQALSAVRDPDVRSQMGARGRERYLNEFSAEHMCQRVFVEYQAASRLKR